MTRLATPRGGRGHELVGQDPWLERASLYVEQDPVGGVEGGQLLAVAAERAVPATSVRPATSCAKSVNGANQVMAVRHEVLVAGLQPVDPDEGDLPFSASASASGPRQLPVADGAPGGEDVHDGGPAPKVRQGDLAGPGQRRQRQRYGHCHAGPAWLPRNAKKAATNTTTTPPVTHACCPCTDQSSVTSSRCGETHDGHSTFASRGRQRSPNRNERTEAQVLAR